MRRAMNIFVYGFFSVKKFYKKQLKELLFFEEESKIGNMKKIVMFYK